MQPELATAREVRRASLLFVEGSAPARERLISMLPECDCSFAADADEALREMHAHAFDAYVLDYWMPDWSGPLLCREIRKNDPNSPVILCTETDDGHTRGSRRARASEYLEKPFEAETLAAKLRALLEFAGAESVRAVAHAERAFRGELGRRSAAVGTSETTADALARLGNAAQPILRTASARARKAFIEAGGTRAEFERWWAECCGPLFSTGNAA